MEMTYTFTCLIISSISLTGGLMINNPGVSLLCILIALLFLFTSIVVAYFEAMPCEHKLKKEYNLKKFITNNINFKNITFCAGSYIFVGLLFAGFLRCTQCSSTPHDYPYHHVITGEGQYEYKDSREQLEDLIMIEKYLKEHPNE